MLVLALAGHCVGAIAGATADARPHQSGQVQLALVAVAVLSGCVSPTYFDLMRPTAQIPEVERGGPG